MNVSPIKQPGALLPLVMFWVALAGAVGAVGLMLRAGHRNNSLVLLALFVIWVSSPFVALTWLNKISQRWPGFTRATLRGVTLILVVGALAIYENMVSAPAGSKLAFPFLMVPLGSWLLIAIVVPAAAVISSGRPRMKPVRWLIKVVATVAMA